MEIKVLTRILEANETIAQENRRVFAENKIFVINLMSAPGAGKTTLLERTIGVLKDRIRIGVIEGDISTNKDSERLQRFGIPVVQINTEIIGGECHLDANMIRNALLTFPLKEIDLLIVENVGNLVCPAEFSIGENKKVMMLSVPEGDDKPLKYPLMFRVFNVLLVNKIDLMEYCSFDIDQMKKDALGINPTLKIFEISLKTGKGLDDWFSWLKEAIWQKERTSAERTFYN